MAKRDRGQGARNGEMSARGGRILVADDDAGVRDVLDQLLRDEGYEVVTAATGQQALNALLAGDDDRPDLALVDQRLPDIDGIQVMQQMLEQGHDVPIILMTAYGTATL